MSAQPITEIQAVLNSLVARIVQCAHPLAIILFGSAVRGRMGPDSDFDLLVIVPDGTPRRQTAMRLHEALVGLGIAADILVATPALLEQHKNNPGLIYQQILSEGREVYRAA